MLDVIFFFFFSSKQLLKDEDSFFLHPKCVCNSTTILSDGANEISCVSTTSAEKLFNEKD